MKKQHIFHHLGKAPYKLISVQMREQDPSGPRVGTSCDYCGAYIVNVFICAGSDSKEFNLGSTCVEKLGDKGLIKQVKEAQRRRKAEARAEKSRLYWAEENKRQEEYKIRKVNLLRRELKKAIPKFETMPHPNAYFADQGKTQRDYLEFFLGDLTSLSDDQLFYNTKIMYAIRDVGGEIV